jgi:hypothetical protein
MQPPSPDVAAQRTQAIDKQRAVCYTVGWVQLVWGIVGFALSFSWMSNVLTLSAGALAIGAW